MKNLIIILLAASSVACASKGNDMAAYWQERGEYQAKQADTIRNANIAFSKL